MAFTAAISSDIDPVVSRMKARSTSRVGGRTRFTPSLRSMTPSLCASEKRVVADVFPAYDDDGGLLVALTPHRGNSTSD